MPSILIHHERSFVWSHLRPNAANATNNASDAPEDVQITGMRIAPQHLLDLQRQPVHAFAHVGPSNGQAHPHPARNRDHRRASLGVNTPPRCGLRYYTAAVLFLTDRKAIISHR
jgi:hypothetical protein